MTEPKKTCVTIGGMAQLFKLSCGHCGNEFEKMMYPSWVARGYAKYCSTSCAATAGWNQRKNGGPRAARRMIRKAGHPLAMKDGRVLYYRYVLYEKIGPGPHQCHWCNDPIEWVTRSGPGHSKGEIAVDHLDGDMHNNEIENLVAACNNCNTLRGLMVSWIERTGLTVTDLF